MAGPGGSINFSSSLLFRFPSRQGRDCAATNAVEVKSARATVPHWWVQGPMVAGVEWTDQEDTQQFGDASARQSSTPIDAHVRVLQQPISWHHKMWTMRTRSGGQNGDGRPSRIARGCMETSHVTKGRARRHSRTPTGPIQSLLFDLAPNGVVVSQLTGRMASAKHGNLTRTPGPGAAGGRSRNTTAWSD
jgi:hypothetical protein